jgi:hypothetical protein
MKAAGTGFLPFMTTTSGLTETRPDTATYTATWLFGTLTGFNVIQIHVS